MLIKNKSLYLGKIIKINMQKKEMHHVNSNHHRVTVFAVKHQTPFFEYCLTQLFIPAIAVN